MTVAINLVVPDGIIYAADSRETYTNARGDVRVGSDHAHKVFQLGPRIGAVTWGWAFLCGRNIHSHVNDFVVSQSGKNRTIEETAKDLGQYFTEQYQKHIKGGGRPVEPNLYALGFLVGGFDQGNQSGKVFEVQIPQISESNFRLIRTTDTSPGAGWRGNTLAISRLMKGFDPRIFELSGATPELRKNLDEAKLDYNLNYWALTSQDAVDLAIFLAHTTIQMLRFSDGIRMAPGDSAKCGGPIDVAVIDPRDGFVWVQRKTLRGERVSAGATISET